MASVIPAFGEEIGRDRRTPENSAILAHTAENNQRDDVSNKMEGKDCCLLRLTSDLHMQALAYVHTDTHRHVQTHV